MTHIRTAVIGSGPAGFYTAGHLLKDGPENLEVDMIAKYVERLLAGRQL